VVPLQVRLRNIERGVGRRVAVVEHLGALTQRREFGFDLFGHGFSAEYLHAVESKAGRGDLARLPCGARQQAKHLSWRRPKKREVGSDSLGTFKA